MKTLGLLAVTVTIGAITVLHVPMVRTPLTELELLKVLDRAHVETFHTRASPARLAMAWAHVAFENGRGRAIFNRNIGNTVPTTSRHAYFCTNGRGCYRSFARFEDSSAIYWLTLVGCPAALVHFDNARAREAADALLACHYYDGDPEIYGAAMRSLFRDAQKLETL